MSDQPQYRTVHKFDRILGEMINLPDVTHTKMSTIGVQAPFVGVSQTFIMQSLRQIDRDGDQSKSRDTLFLQSADDEGLVRLVIPHEAIQVILRQHDSLGTKTRRKAGKAQAAARKARGELPGFMRKKGGTPS